METVSHFFPESIPVKRIQRTFGFEGAPVTLSCPVVEPRVVNQVADQITQARDSHLTKWPITRIIDAIDSTIQHWLEPQSSFLERAVKLMPAITGYSPEMIKVGIPAVLKPFRKPGLTAMVESEFGDICMADSQQMLGPRLTACFLAGNIPAVAVQSIVQTLLLKSACFIKSASRDPIFPTLFAQSMAEVDHNLSGAIAVLWWEGGDEAVERVLLNASDAVIASGSDSSINALKSQIPPQTKFLGYGQRISFAAIGRELLTQSKLSSLSRKAAWDLALFDQQGCVSPQAIFVEAGGTVSPGAFAQALSSEMQHAEELIPRGRLTVAESVSVQKARSGWQLRQATGEPLHLYQSKGSTAWTVVYDPSLNLQATCLNRTIRVVSIDDLSFLPRIVAPMSNYLQTAGLATSRHRFKKLASALASVGVNRTCGLGNMQHPPPSWPHDGHPNLLNLVTWSHNRI